MTTKQKDLPVGRATARPIAWTPRWTGDGPRFVDELIGWMLSIGRRTYDGRVTLLDHSLKTAALAKADGARETLVVAALLHDLGHALSDVVSSEFDEPLSHERLAASWLARFYPESITEPIRLHVEAKRWLVANEPGYAGTLSPGSLASLVEQGGPMTPHERRAFEALPFASSALSLRRWDEVSKAQSARFAPLETYRAALLKHLTAGR
ncbi:MAG: HD domain-containing protein [Planctomycetota bacterium]